MLGDLISLIVFREMAFPKIILPIVSKIIFRIHFLGTSKSNLWLSICSSQKMVELAIAISTISIFLVKSFVYKIYQISKNQSDSGMKLRPENETFKNKYFDKKKILRLNSKGKFWYHMILTAVWKWKEILMFTIFHI